MNKRIEEMSITQLQQRRAELERTIKICEDYLDSAHNTFLGPLGAKAEIKKCQKEIALIKAEIIGRWEDIDD